MGIGHGIAKDDALGTAPVLIIRFRAEGGDLELLVFFENDYDAELASDGDSPGKELFDLIRQSRGGHVVIRWVTAKEIIADTAADPKSGKAGFLKALDDSESKVTDRVFFLRCHI